MTNKAIIAGLVAIAFVAGSIMTSSAIFAEKDDGKKGDPIVNALNNIATTISGIHPTVNVNPTPVAVSVDPTPVTVNVDPTPITINAPQGEKGIQGVKGDKGDKGDTGSQGPGLLTYVKSSFGTTDGSTTLLFLNTSCDQGDVALGGGWSDLQDNNGYQSTMRVIHNSPLIDNNGKSVGWSVIATSTFPGKVTVYSICQDLTP